MNTTSQARSQVVFYLLVAGLFLAFSIFGASYLNPEIPQNIIIEEQTTYGIVSNDLYLTLTDNLHKDQYIKNITLQFADSEKTDTIELTDFLLYQSYDVPIYGDANLSLGKYKTAKLVFWDENISTFDNLTQENITTTITFNRTAYYDKSDVEMPCDYVLADKSCLQIIQSITGYNTQYDYLPVPNTKTKEKTKEKIVQDGLKIKQKVAGSIPMAKGGQVKIKIPMSHLLFYGIEVEQWENKYDITVCSEDGCSLLDPTWWNASYKFRREINVTTIDGGLEQVVKIPINQSILGESIYYESVVFTNSTDSVLPFWYDVVAVNKTGTTYFYVNLSGSNSLNMYYSTINMSPQTNRDKVFIMFEPFDTNDMAGWGTKYCTGTEVFNTALAYGGSGYSLTNNGGTIRHSRSLGASFNTSYYSVELMVSSDYSKGYEQFASGTGLITTCSDNNDKTAVNPTRLPNNSSYIFQVSNSIMGDSARFNPNWEIMGWTYNFTSDKVTGYIHDNAGTRETTARGSLSNLNSITYMGGGLSDLIDDIRVWKGSIDKNVFVFGVKETVGNSTVTPTIQSPANITYVLDSPLSIDLSYTLTNVVGTIDKCWYNTSTSATPVTLTDCTNTTITHALRNAGYTVYIYANTTEGVMGSASVSYFINKTPCQYTGTGNYSLNLSLGCNITDNVAISGGIFETYGGPGYLNIYSNITGATGYNLGSVGSTQVLSTFGFTQVDNYTSSTNLETPALFEVVNDMLYVFDYAMGDITTYNISNSSDLVYVHRYGALGDNANQIFFYHPYSGNLYVTNIGTEYVNGYIREISIDNPNAPTLEDTWDPSTNADSYTLRAFAGSNASQYLYVSRYSVDSFNDEDSSITVIDTDTMNFVRHYESAYIDDPRDAEVYNGYLYVVMNDDNSLVEFDLSSPSSPSYRTRIVNSTSMSGPVQLTMGDDLAFVGNTGDDIAIINVSNASSLVQVGYYTSSEILGINNIEYDSAKKLLYVVANAGTSAINVSNPAAPVLYTHSAAIPNSLGVGIKDDNIYIGSGTYDSVLSYTLTLGSSVSCTPTTCFIRCIGTSGVCLK